jgi:hypothetical protein
MARKKKRRVRQRADRRRIAKHSRSRISSRTQESKTRGLAAINDVRRGKYKTLSAAARSEGTSVKSIKRLLPGALLPSRKSGRLRVRAGDRYSALVEILTDVGVIVVTARGSRERELAGKHRAAYLSVLRWKNSGAVLKKFSGKTVGGRRLLSSYRRLLELARGGIIDDLAALYVSPEASV